MQDGNGTAQINRRMSAGNRYLQSNDQYFLKMATLFISSVEILLLLDWKGYDAELEA